MREACRRPASTKNQPSQRASSIVGVPTAADLISFVCFPFRWTMAKKKGAASGDSRWNQQVHGKAIEKKFDSGEWDPNNTDDAYIIERFKSFVDPAGKVNLRQFLSESNQGKKGNRGNQKALGGYKRTAGEWFVALALSGVRKSECSFFVEFFDAILILTYHSFLQRSGLLTKPSKLQVEESLKKAAK